MKSPLPPSLSSVPGARQPPETQSQAVWGLRNTRDGGCAKNRLRELKDELGLVERERERSSRMGGGGTTEPRSKVFAKEKAAPYLLEQGPQTKLDLAHPPQCLKCRHS